MRLSASEDLLPRYLEANWLKPFDAVWDASVAAVLTSIARPEPSLDLGCGDGLFMLIASGGTVHLDDDRYTDAARAVRSPEHQVTVGLDRKAGLLARARRTGAYRSVVRGDGQALPFQDGAFASVFSNILYWLPDWRSGLQEMRRVLIAGGRLVLVVPNRGVGTRLASHARAQCYREAGRTRLAKRFDRIDNGRYDTMTRLTGDAETWSARLTDSGFRLTGKTPVLDPGTVARWDLSTRPFLPLLMRIGRILRAAGLKSVVKRLVVPMMTRRVRRWVRRSLEADERSCGLWVLVAEPVPATKSAEAMVTDVERIAHTA